MRNSVDSVDAESAKQNDADVIADLGLENSFFTVCSDKEGVFSLVNRWSDIVMYGINDVKAKLSKIIGESSSTTDDVEYIYKKAKMAHTN